VKAVAHPIGMMAQLAQNAVRFGWYYGLNHLLDRQASRTGITFPRYRPVRPVPERQELLGALGRLLIEDAAAVRDGLYPPIDDEGLTLGEHFGRVRDMFGELPAAMQRRQQRDAGTARAVPQSSDLPEYFTQDFHFQGGGYLSEESARIYDVQVETLFYGSAGAMRRAGMRSIAAAARGRDQRKLALLDVACGTGRFLRQLRLAFPAMQLAGLDLSQPYLDEAAHHLHGLRAAHLMKANAESIPLGDASQDFVTAIFLYHELPGDVRRRVTEEIARVLKPGGLFIFVDSLQLGDRPGWDGLLEAFPVRFHEPYYRHYLIEDLEGMFATAGMGEAGSSLAFLSKVMVRRKADAV
jgi:ubiquinone/menaquinone biosynthesis C-methylase UbiE